MRKLRDVLAIDGPAGVGKSTVARFIAKELGFLFVNTGDMYRALTWKAMREKINLRDRRRVAQFLKKSMQWSFREHEGVFKIDLDGKELGRELRSERVSRQTPAVAQIPSVRQYLRYLQRQLALKGRAVLEGRDTTTHVTPDAQVKIYLDADVHERAQRRFRQLHNEGRRVKFESIEAAIRQRDYRERRRGILPAHRSPGTITIDTTKLGLHQVSGMILDIYHGRHSA